MAIIPIAERLADIQEQGKRLTRRIEKMQADHDFLVDSMISRPWANMTAQRRLLNEWSEEIEQMKLDLEYLRIEWKRLNEINNSKSKNKKEYGTSKENSSERYNA